jgi:hypothetical protein
MKKDEDIVYEESARVIKAEALSRCFETRLEINPVHSQ